MPQDDAQLHIVLVKGWIKKGKQFLLAKRAATELQAPGKWSLPGGKVDQRCGKNVLQETLREELLEEVGVEIGENIELVYNNAFIRVDGLHVVGMTFLCHFKSGEPAALDETIEVRWFTLEELHNFTEAPDFLRAEIEELHQHLSRRVPFEDEVAK